MAPDVNAPIDYKVALELLNDFSEKFFGESQYKLSNFCRITQKDKYNLLHLKMGEKDLHGFLIFTTQVFEKEEFNNPLRLLEDLSMFVVRKKISELMLPLKEALIKKLAYSI